MEKFEKLSAVTIGVISGITIAYIGKCKELERLNGIQAETIADMRKYIESEWEARNDRNTDESCI